MQHSFNKAEELIKHQNKIILSQREVISEADSIIVTLMNDNYKEKIKHSEEKIKLNSKIDNLENTNKRIIKNSNIKTFVLGGIAILEAVGLYIIIK